MIKRWLQYQKERFPLAAHGPLVLVLSLSALAVSALLRGRTELPDIATIAGAFFSAISLFFMLRIADEFKDREEDLRYRPHLPVPRGLITLRGLWVAAVICAFGQIAVALWIEPNVLILLFAVWLYMALMAKEFFVVDWLKSRLLIYMLSHMPVIPLIVFYVSAFDWAANDLPPPIELSWLMGVSYFIGIVLEIGRKLRAPNQEVTGVVTYSAAWGIHSASLTWLVALCLASLAALPLANEISFLIPMVGITTIVIAMGIWAVYSFLNNSSPTTSKRIEHASAIAILALFLAVGPLPLLVR